MNILIISRSLYPDRIGGGKFLITILSNILKKT